MNIRRLLIFISLSLGLGNLVLLGITISLWLKISRVPLEVFIVEEYRPADIEVDVAISKGSMEPFWQAFAQGGEELGGEMLTPTVTQMKQLQPRYVRLDHIFDDDYYGVVKGSGQYDFSRLDRVVDQISAMGAKPFFSLGYMPKAIAETKIAAPRNWDDWFGLVKATVEHYSGRQGKNLSDVYYEVWNEPDLESFGSWTRGGEKNYLTLYSVSARAAAAASANRFYIGGPATTALYKNWVVDLVNFTKDNQLRLDFISWHRYSFSPKRFSEDMKETYDWLGQERNNYQWIISEWGPTPEKSGTYGSSYAAAHAFAVIRQLLDSAQGIYAFEIKDGPEQGNSGWGILAHEAAGLWKKPRFNAFSWLKQAWGKRIGLKGEGSNVTGWALKREEGVVDLYLVNFAASEGKQERVPIRFVNLTPGEYEIQQQFLINSKQNTKMMAQTTSGRLFVTLNLPANEVVRVQLKSLEIFDQAFLEGKEATSFSEIVR